MGKEIIVILAFAFVFKMNAQEIVERDGLLKAYLTISPGFMLNTSDQPFYFHGNLEVYTSENISIAGDGYFFLGDLTEQGAFRFHNSLFAGFNWHPLKDGSSDFFIGIQPGLTFTTLSTEPNDSQTGINPVVSINIGYNYFVNEYFNFFLLGKTIFGQHSTYAFRSLNEFRLSAGLGFSIPTKSKNQD